MTNLQLGQQPRVLVTRREARLIADAHEALQAIEARASESAWGASADRARNLGRLAGVADLARDALLAVAHYAGSYCGDDKALNAIRAARDARTGVV